METTVAAGVVLQNAAQQDFKNVNYNEFIYKINFPHLGTSKCCVKFHALRPTNSVPIC